MTKFHRLPCWLALAGLLFAGGVSNSYAGGIHYKINTSTTFYTDSDDKLAGMRMNWVYDPEVSGIITEGRDTSATGLKQIAEDILLDLQELDYFAEFSMNSKPVKLGKVTVSSMKLTDQKSLQLGFQLPLQKAVAVDGKAFGLTLSDPYATADMNYSSAERIVLDKPLNTKCNKPELVSQAVTADEHELTIHSVILTCK